MSAKPRFNNWLHWQVHHAIHGPNQKWWFATLVRNIPSTICLAVHWPFCLMVGHHWVDTYLLRYSDIKQGDGDTHWERCTYCHARKR